MKRSEMVHKIVNLLYDATDGSGWISLQDADLFLLFLEKAGMAPPKITKEVLRQEVVEVNPEEGAVTFGPVYELGEVYEWEPEDSE